MYNSLLTKYSISKVISKISLEPKQCLLLWEQISPRFKSRNRPQVVCVSTVEDTILKQCF